MRRYGKSSYVGLGLQTGGNGKSRPRSCWFPGTPKMDRGRSRWISRFLRLPSGVSALVSCFRSGFLFLRRLLMFLHRCHLNLRCKEVRRDLANPYELHSTLCRAFSEPNRKCPEGEFLWRLEPETDDDGCPRVLVQSRSLPEWSRIGIQEWFAQVPDPAIDLIGRLKLNSLQAGRKFRFRLRANPCVCRQGKRLGLFRQEEQEAWIERKGREQHGFSLPRLESFGLVESTKQHFDVRISQEQMLRGQRRNGTEIRVFSVLYDGFLTVIDPAKFRLALLGNCAHESDSKKEITMGIGHGKVMGLGLLSVVPIR